MIRQLLLLFNVESVRLNGERSFWFPFDRFKFDGKRKVTWSLEHIHAVNSQKATPFVWREWLRLHKKTLENMPNVEPELIKEIDSFLKRKNLAYAQFSVLQEKIIKKLSPPNEESKYIHSLANLVLLKHEENSALSNSTFEVKRNEIIAMDMRGEFIPFCTKMVFLKYYTKSEDHQVHFWSQTDRIAYLEAINEVLKDYLSEPIITNYEGM